jgi:type IV pilus assembly protein PilE
MTVTRCNARHSAAGFTLIEVMIAVLVVAILGAIAFPAYQDQVRKGKRAEGKAALLRAAQMQEREYTSNGNYTADLGKLFGIPGQAVFSGEDDPIRGSYQLTITPAATGGYQQGYTLIATPSAVSAVAPAPTVPATALFADPDCGVLTLTSTGVRTFTFSGDAGKSNKDRCW